MQRPAVGTSKMPYSKSCDTFRPALRQRTARATGLGSPTFGNYFAFAAKRNRFVRQHVTEHRPACVTNGFRHFGAFEAGRIHISDVNLRMVTSDLARFNVEEMLAPVGDLGRQGAGADLLPARLVHRQLPLAGAVKARRSCFRRSMWRGL